MARGGIVPRAFFIRRSLGEGRFLDKNLKMG